MEKERKRMQKVQKKQKRQVNIFGRVLPYPAVKCEPPQSVFKSGPGRVVAYAAAS